MSLIPILIVIIKAAAKGGGRGGGCARYVNKITGEAASMPPPLPRGGVLADDMGMGKTVTFAALLLRSESFRKRVYLNEQVTTVHVSNVRHKHTTCRSVGATNIVHAMNQHIFRQAAAFAQRWFRLAGRAGPR